MIRSLATLAALALLVTACAQRQPDASPSPLPELAVEPDAIETEPSPVAPTAGTDNGPSPTTPNPPPTTPSAEAPRTPGSDPAPETGTATQPPAQPRSFATFLAVEDPSGDEGLEAPSYADLRTVTLQDDGDRLRVWVDVGADLPRTLADGEVIGLGVDLYPAGDESDGYQLFADGGSDGWHAYFQTPRGFVAYPGTFGLGGRRVEFVIPWGSLGTPPRGDVKVFLDWSQARPILNAAGSDYAPARGTRRWAR